MSFNVVTILLLLASVQGLLLTALIFQKYRRPYANRSLIPSSRTDNKITEKFLAKGE